MQQNKEHAMASAHALQHLPEDVCRHIKDMYVQYDYITILDTGHLYLSGQEMVQDNIAMFDSVNAILQRSKRSQIRSRFIFDMTYHVSFTNYDDWTRNSFITQLPNHTVENWFEDMDLDSVIMMYDAAYFA